jgi:tetratricopeptide (TPR) repeat protein
MERRSFRRLISQPCLAAGMTAILASALLHSAANAQLQDRVYSLTGSPSSGTIGKMTPSEVMLGSARRPVNEIKRLEFGGEPRELTAARQLALQGQYEKALESLKKIDRNAVKRGFIAQDILYFEAYSQAKLALRGTGDKRAAASAVADFRTKFPENFHFFEASQLFGELAVASNSFAAAEDAFKALLQAPWDDYKMKASVLVGRAMIAQEKYAEAAKEFDKVAGQAVNSAAALRQKRFAAVGKAMCLAETGAIDEGVKMVTQIVAENDPQDSELMGRAYNALGRCHLKAGRDMDALLAYLRVDLLFFSNPDIHAESLYHLRTLWEKANKQNRAVQAKNLLEQRYAGTRWATKTN